jgi:SAM-dependent methyltransferase
MVDGTFESIQHHYDVEQKLADRLRHSTPAERLYLYQEMYDLLFQQVPDHPLVTPDLELRQRVVRSQFAFLQPLIPADGVFMEVGAGDCRLAIAMAARARQVIAIDVSAEISKEITFPSNCEFVVSTGCQIPVAPESVTLAFSDQLMEHLHPDDALIQLRQIYSALSLGGMYVFFTPNRLSGPHDVSKYFDTSATGLHLKEYTTWELYSILRAAGYRSVYVPFQVRGSVRFVPAGLICAMERVVAMTPRPLRRGVVLRRPMKKMLGRIAAVK